MNILTLKNSDMESLFVNNLTENIKTINKPFCSIRMRAESIDSQVTFIDSLIQANKPTRIQNNEISEESSLFLVYIVQGCTSCCCSAWESPIALEPGQFFLGYTPLSSGYNDFKDKHPVYCSELHINPKLLKEILVSDPRIEVKKLFAPIINNPEQGFLLKSDMTPEITNLVHEFKQQKQVGLMNAFSRKAKAYELIQLSLDKLVYNHNKSPKLNLSVNDVVKLENIKTILRDNIQSPPTLTKLSKMVELNEFKLKRGFKQLNGKTVFEHLHHIRMTRAAILLLESNRSILDIAQEVGYNNHGHFSSAFKEFHGNTPSSYRKINLLL